MESKITQDKIVISKDDIKEIIQKQIPEQIYIMYNGLSQNDFQGMQKRKSLIKNDFLLILKAFFFPSSAIKKIPIDMIDSNIDRDIADIMLKSIKPEEELKNAYEATLQQVFKFNNMSYEDFKKLMPVFGYARRFEILVDHFKLDEELVCRSLYSIQHETTKGLQ